jgi:hypothetical protein
MLIALQQQLISGHIEAHPFWSSMMENYQDNVISANFTLHLDIFMMPLIKVVMKML